MEGIVKSVAAETVALFPQVSREELREKITNNLAAIIVERQLQEIRQRAIKAVREALRPTIDQAMAAALEVIEREDDESWAAWQKTISAQEN
jgi:hypothetical protein